MKGHQLAEAAAEQRFRVFSAYAQQIMLGAGWQLATLGGKPEPMVSRHGPIIKIRAIDPEGVPHSAAFDGEIDVAAFLNEVATRPRKRPQAEPEAAPAPSAPAVDELANLRAQLEAAQARVAELEAAPAAATAPEYKFPAPDERLSDWDMVGVSDTERGVLKTAMEDGESVSAAKRRLYPILNEELSRLQNQEALLGASTPESVSARRKEVESLLGILARVGDA